MNLKLFKVYDNCYILGWLLACQKTFESNAHKNRIVKENRKV